mmetsp:Transcript_96300/g.272241  ORF Transcript_96300/g.272241 Transcript_96300/m.272241 type:complete len:323 (+) Transcript_96300:906-1874(+)
MAGSHSSRSRRRRPATPGPCGRARAVLRSDHRRCSCRKRSASVFTSCGPCAGGPPHLRAGAIATKAGATQYFIEPRLPQLFDFAVALSLPKHLPIIDSPWEDDWHQIRRPQLRLRLSRKLFLPEDVLVLFLRSVAFRLLACLTPSALLFVEFACSPWRNLAVGVWPGRITGPCAAGMTASCRGSRVASNGVARRPWRGRRQWRRRPRRCDVRRKGTPAEILRNLLLRVATLLARAARDRPQAPLVKVTSTLGTCKPTWRAFRSIQPRHEGAHARLAFFAELLPLLITICQPSLRPAHEVTNVRAWTGAVPARGATADTAASS